MCTITVQGDTLQNVVKQLNCIIETGCYYLCLGEDGKGHLFLEFEPSSSQKIPTTFLGELQQNEIIRQKWSNDQIGDFVRKLGFLDEDNEGEDQAKIKDFLYQNQVN